MKNKFQKPPRKRRRNILRRFMARSMGAFISLIITLLIALGMTYVVLALQLPDVSMLKDAHMQVPLRVYTSDGKLLAEYGEKKRIPITLAEVPKQMIDAVLATEDVRFFSHPGIDFIGMVRAAVAVMATGRKVQGASTITMQVARNFFLNPEKTYYRKVREVMLALKIDKTFSKEKILELYLNKVYFGQHAYGVAAAAQVYFGKNLNELSLPEMATIAGLPQAPSRDNPLNNPDAALKRRNHVLDRMLEVGFITKADHDRALNAPLNASYHGWEAEANAPYIAEMTRQVMVQKFGDSAYEEGFKVYTTIIPNLQDAANKALQDGLIAYADRHGYIKPKLRFGNPTAKNRARWIEVLRLMNPIDNLFPAAITDVQPHSVTALLGNGQEIYIPWEGLVWARPALEEGYKGAPPQRARDVVAPGDVVRVKKQANGEWWLAQLPKVQGGLISMNPQNGAILALVGGFDYSSSTFNRVTQAERQPGSNFKPFLYSAALDKGFTLATIVNDAPIVVKQYDSFWRPMNDEMKFYGPTRLRMGLVKSRNLVSIRVLQDIGVRYAVDYISRFGFPTRKLPKSLSLALGTGVATPLQVAAGYSVFANGGYQITPFFINKIIGQKNQVIYQAMPPQACSACITNPALPEKQRPYPEAVRAISAQNAFLITSALKDVIQMGTGRGAKVLNRSDLAGKTGTNQIVDAWFSGYNSKIETTVWVGNDDFKPVYEHGSEAALPIWIQYMREALQGMPESTMPQPPNIIAARINPYTGAFAKASQDNAIFEYFQKKSPSQDVNTIAGEEPDESAPSQASSDVPTSSSNNEDDPLF